MDYGDVIVHIFHEDTRGYYDLESLWMDAARVSIEFVVRIAIIAVGKVKQPGLRAEIDDYLARIGRYARCREIELKDGSERELEERFRRAIGDRTRTIALEVEGVSWTSQRFARFVGQCEGEGVGTIAYSSVARTACLGNLESGGS